MLLHDASRPSEHPPVREEHVKTFRWDHRLLVHYKRRLYKESMRRISVHCANTPVASTYILRSASYVKPPIRVFLPVLFSLAAVDGPQCARLPIPPTATLPSYLWSLWASCHLSPVLSYEIISWWWCEIQHSYTPSTNALTLLTRIRTLSATEAIIKILIWSTIEPTTSALTRGLRA